MTPLGKGLASLIPRRRGDAKKLLDQIDQMESLDTPENNQEDTSVEEVREVTYQKRISVVEESSGDDMNEESEEISPPPKPLVTPLPFDVFGRARVVEEKEEEVPQQNTTPIETAPSKEKKADWDRHEGEVRAIPISDIKINPMQPRRYFDAEELEELKNSIARHGILQPLVVRRTDTGYELISGERRLRSAQLLGWEKVPCVVRKDVAEDETRLELALIENIQREDLNPIEQALAFKQLNEEYGMSHEEIGNRVGISRVLVTNTLRLLHLPPEVQKGLTEGKITSGHGRAVLMIPDKEKQLRFYEHMVDEGLTVRKAELRARRIQRLMHVDNPARLKRNKRTTYGVKYKGVLEDLYGHQADVRFLATQHRYEVVFTAHTENDLEDLMGRLTSGNVKRRSDTEDIEEGLDEESE